VIPACEACYGDCMSARHPHQIMDDRGPFRADQIRAGDDARNDGPTLERWIEEASVARSAEEALR
jgi:hypothetical protein